LFAAPGSLAATLALLTCVLVSYSSFKGPFWALSSAILPSGLAAAGIAWINAFSNLVAGGMVSLVGLLQDATGSYALALTPIVAFAAVGGLIVLAMTSGNSAAQRTVVERKAGTTLGH
jgi:MFS transporter, ACS family, tartrate transporter